jgi:hypothetical protein
VAKAGRNKSGDNRNKIHEESILLESYEDGKSEGFTLIDIDRKMSLSVNNNQNPEYSRDELIHLANKYEMI